MGEEEETGEREPPSRGGETDEWPAVGDTVGGVSGILSDRGRAAGGERGCGIMAL